jgi:PAS domain S-box-containing protein
VESEVYCLTGGLTMPVIDRAGAAIPAPRIDPFPALLEAAPDAMIIVDEAGQIRLLTAQAEAMFGYRRQELTGQPIEVLLPERFRRHPARRRQYAAEKRVRPMGAGLDLHGLRKDGSEFPVEISLSPLPSGPETLVVAAIRDVSERRAAEHRIRELALIAESCQGSPGCSPGWRRASASTASRPSG